MLSTKTNLMDEYFKLVFEILEHKTVESYIKYHLKSFFVPDCQSELANQLREKLSDSIQSRNKLESKLDRVASELYDKNNIPLLKTRQNDYENALVIFNDHFSKLVS